MQVSTPSHEWLAKINERGLLTVNSQDGQTHERAYVWGYMPLNHAHLFIDMLNCFCDKMCLLIRPCDNGSPSWIPMTRWDGKGVANTWLYDDKLTLDSEKEVHNIPLNINLGFVVVIDPTWERKAYNKGGLWPDIIAGLDRMQSTLKEKNKTSS
jgi:hypothetical protein